MVIVMDDHTIRWGIVRAQIQGKLEERLPFLQSSHPSAGFKKVHWNCFKSEEKTGEAHVMVRRVRNLPAYAYVPSPSEGYYPGT